MSKQSRRIKQTAIKGTRPIVAMIGFGETHEPTPPKNWPYGHADITESSDEDDECFIITIHGTSHYLHASTAYELLKKMAIVIKNWDEKCKKMGLPGVI